MVYGNITRRRAYNLPTATMYGMNSTLILLWTNFFAGFVSMFYWQHWGGVEFELIYISVESDEVNKLLMHKIGHF